MRLSRREKVLLALLIVLGGLYLTDHYLFQPLLIYKRHLIEENNRLSMELQQWEEKTNQYHSLQQQEPGIEADYQQMQAKVPSSPMISDIIVYLETSAREARVKLVSIQYRESAPSNYNSEESELANERAKPLNFQIVASGSHFNLLSFILKIENAPRIYIINSSKISLVRTASSSYGPAVEPSSDDTRTLNDLDTQAVPESLAYDMDNSQLNLDFNAYYDDSDAQS